MLIDDNHEMSSTQEAPPLMSALTSGRCRFKWTRLADLPAPLYLAYVAVHGHKIYVAGANSPVESTVHQVYVYNINTDQWGQLPPSGHYYGIPHIIGDKLAIIGGRLSATKEMTKKVSTFDDGSQTWTSYYPDLLRVRSLPGVVSHQEYVIVAGGLCSDNGYPEDDIEILNWMENSHWRRASIRLPAYMYEFIPIISDDHLLIVGYAGMRGEAEKDFYKLPVDNIVASFDERNHSAASRQTTLTAITDFYTALVPGSSPPVIVGGWNHSDKTSTADIKMYDNSDHSWKSVGSLSSARSHMAVAAVDDNTIVVIGGCTKGGSSAECRSSSLTTVELGEAELLH